MTDERLRAAIELDYLTPLAEARRIMGPEQILLGNLDPVRALRDGTPPSITAALRQCHQEAGSRYIVGAGCEVPRETPPENLRALCQYSREHAPCAQTRTHARSRN